MKLPRPHIPLSARCAVAARQLGRTADRGARSWSEVLADLLGELAPHLGCAISELNLDHDPALGAREKVIVDGEIVGYRPDANDPEYLIYRSEADHRFKTNVRGDGAQYPDRVLIKRERKRHKAKAKTKKKWPTRKIPSRPFNAGPSRLRRPKSPRSGLR